MPGDSENWWVRERKSNPRSPVLGAHMKRVSRDLEEEDVGGQRAKYGFRMITDVLGYARLSVLDESSLIVFDCMSSKQSERRSSSDLQLDFQWFG